MSKYANRLSADEKTLKAAGIVTAEAGARAQVEQKISGLKARKATLTAAYESALGANPFNFDKVFNLTQEAKANDDQLALAESILSSEFGA